MRKNGQFKDMQGRFLSDVEILPLVFRMSPRHKHTPTKKEKQSERLSLNGWNVINKCRGVMQRPRLD